MIFTENHIAGSWIVKQEEHSDDRGFFARWYCEKEFAAKGLNTKWVQANNSLSIKPRTLRGLHYQEKPNEEVKLVRCIRGKIWDVIVDLRTESITYSKWFGTELSANNRHMMYVPKGCAHGFLSLTANSELLYLVSNNYAPQSERTLVWNDPDIGVLWPTPPLLISLKDRSGLSFRNISQLTQ
jgi:dTDP-4-dehydrorhamnose 3,5-epimerase